MKKFWTRLGPIGPRPSLTCRPLGTYVIPASPLPRRTRTLRRAARPTPASIETALA